MKALARAGAGGDLNVTRRTTSLNGGVTGELGSGVTAINVDGGTVAAADQIVIQVRDANDVVLHTETIIAGTVTAGTPFAVTNTCRSGRDSPYTYSSYYSFGYRLSSG